MSDKPNPIRLELLGEMIRRLQADLRSMRDEAKANRQSFDRETATIRATMLDVVTAVNDRIAAGEARLDSRLDQMSEVLFAICDKLGVEYRR
jgi:hypothetical protein